MSCVFFGAPGVVPVVFPETFTAYQLLQAGDRACLRCHTMLTNGQYRRKCFCIKNGVFTEIKDALAFLVAMPPPPYVLYLTKQKCKHGWIGAVQNPVLNVNRFILCVDEDRIMFDRAKFSEHLQFLETLWALELPKGVMLGGYPPVTLP